MYFKHLLHKTEVFFRDKRHISLTDAKLFCTIGWVMNVNLNINIGELTNVYTFKSDKKNWANKVPRALSIVSYQVDGQYDHTFPFGVLQVKKDHVFTINPKDVYTVEQIASGESICFTFFSKVEIPTELIDCTADPRFSVLFRKLLKYKNLNHEGTYYMALSVAYEILALIAEKRDSRYYQISKNIPYIEARDYLTENFGDNSLCIKSLHEKYGVSDKYFRDRFRELFGSTPTRYLIELRLSAAARLLSSGTHSVSKVAEMVGFSDVYYFSRLFKKRFLCPPTSFKSQKE